MVDRVLQDDRDSQPDKQRLTCSPQADHAAIYTLALIPDPGVRANFVGSGVPSSW
jgi:hypothetical protein